MRKNPLDFSEKRLKITKKYYNKRNILITILILVSVCFFYSKGVRITPSLKAEAEELNILNSPTMQNTNEWYFEKLKKSFQKEENKDIEEEKEEIIPEFSDNNDFENEILSITKDHPIEEMAPFIAEYDRKIAGLIVGIAKKESNWGKRSPSKNGKTCYNYWGYKGAGSLGTAMGYGCFASPEEAVDAIGGRITELADQSLDTPAKVVVWKCGRNCAATGGQAAANKWISDVNVYYSMIVNS